MYDVIIIGKGPAGISASLYTTRGKLNTLIVGGESWLAKAHKIDNYYGFPDGIDGNKLLSDGEKQASNLGAKIIDENVVSIAYDNNLYKIVTNENEYETKSILFSTGQIRNRVKIENIEKFEGKGVHYCVVCDGFFYREKKVGILGFTDYAIHEALELKNFSENVTIYTNGNQLEINDNNRKILGDNNFNINDKRISSFIGDNNLEKILFDDSTEEDVEGIFVAYGSASSSDFARKLGIVLNKSLINVDQNLQTNIPGIFAAGDCASEFKQISVAVGQGAIAGQRIVEYIRELNK